MANWNLPSISDLYANIISLFKARDVDLAKGLDPAHVTVTNPEQGFIRWNSANARWEIYSGTSWIDLSTIYNINVDKVDGCDAGTAANNILKLDSEGKVPVATLPATTNALEALMVYGLLVKSAAGALVARMLAAGGSGIAITNGDGVSGNPTISLANDIAALEALSGTGFAVRTGADTWAQRSIAAGAGLSVANGDGVSGNPTISISSAELLALVSLVSAADKLPYFTGPGTAALATFTAAARALLDDPDASSMLTTLGVSNFAKTLLDDTSASAVLTTLGVSSFIQTLLDDPDAATARATLGVPTSSGKLLRITRYTTPGSGTWTKQSDVGAILIRAVGGGGGGGSGYFGNSGGGGGGGAGGYQEAYITSPAASYTYVVGAGGVGGSPGSSGGAGGNTTIAGLTAYGGAGGGSGGVGSSGLGGSGGSGFIQGGNGTVGILGITSSGDYFGYGGAGGNSVFGGAGGGGSPNAYSTPGVFGGGGGGGGTGGYGASGGAGYIEIWEFAP